MQKNGSGTVSGFSSLDPYTSHYPAGGEGVLPYKRLMGMCRWMGLHSLNDWIHYKEVAFSVVTRIGSPKFFDFWGKTVLHIYG